MQTTIEFFDEVIELRLKVAGEYHNGMKAIEAIDASNQLFGRLTVNVADVQLEADEIIVKNYSENELWVPQVLSNLSKNFIPTGKTVKSGFVTLPIYKFVE